MKRRTKRMLCALAVLGAGVGLGVVPGSPASAATPVCTQAWRLVSPTYSYLNYVPLGSGANFTCNLKQGDTGNGVKGLQRTLNSCYGFSLSVDGQFGPATYAALRKVQDKVGATVDGQFGPETRYLMAWLQGYSAAKPCLPYDTPLVNAWNADTRQL